MVTRKFLVNPKSRRASIHGIGPDGVSALCNQSDRYPRDGFAGREIQEIDIERLERYNPAHIGICLNCRNTSERLSVPEKQRTKRKTRRDIELEKLARWNGEKIE